jgi:hypothetical protein
VWAVPIGRRGQAFFCGSDVAAAEPAGTQTGDRKRVREWKDILYYRMKKITPPHGERARALWRRYQEAARRV